MTSLQFSVMRASDGEMALLRQLLAEFEARHPISIELLVLEWPTAWPELVHLVTNGRVPDISVVGSSWISSLCGMQALRPFSATEMQRFGGEIGFVPELWRTGVRGSQVWALPWLADTRVVYFWRTALERVGLDETQAFVSCAAIEHTVATLERGELPAIIAATTRDTDNQLHDLAGWVWSLGGDFWSDWDHRVLFGLPITVQAIQRYLALYRSLAASALDKLNDEQSDGTFVLGQAAVTVSGPWVYGAIATRRPDALDDLGIAAMPGVPYVGGSHLVVWRRCLQAPAALDLIEFLTSRSVQRRLNDMHGQLSARLDVLIDPDRRADRFFRLFSHSVRHGRALPNDPMWGVVEERLTQTLAGLWGLALDPATTDLALAVSTPLVRLAYQLNLTLGRK